MAGGENLDWNRSLHYTRSCPPWGLPGTGKKGFTGAAPRASSGGQTSTGSSCRLALRSHAVGVSGHVSLDAGGTSGDPYQVPRGEDQSGRGLFPVRDSLSLRYHVPETAPRSRNEGSHRSAAGYQPRLVDAPVNINSRRKQTQRQHTTPSTAGKLNGVWSPHSRFS